MRRRSFPNFIGDVVSQQQRIDSLERIMRIIGFTPDLPYTLTVNDGTRNRVELGKIGSDYGIKIVDNAGNEIILANGTIIANAIKSGTLDCDLITVANLSASVITTGVLNADLITTGTLNCSLIGVQNLSAASITVGTFASPNDRFTTGSLSGIKLSDGTITGNKLVAYTIQADNIDSNAITSDKISAGAITADKISVRTITADRIKVSSITTSEINYVSGSKLVDGSVSHDKISVTSLSAINANLGTVNAGTINGLNFNIGGSWGGYARFYGSSAAEFRDSGNNTGGIIYAPGSGFLGVAANTYLVLVGSTNILCDDDLDMDSHNIGSVNDIYARNFINYCEVAEGIDPFKVLASFKAKSSDKNKKWKKLDHSKLDKEVYAKRKKVKKAVIGNVIDPLTKKKVRGIVREDIIEEEGYSINKLIELQRQAILILKNEVDKLKQNKIN